MFIIKTKDGDLKVSIDHVFEQILRKSYLDFDKNTNIKNLNAFIEHINKTLSTSQLDITHSQLYSIYFLAGYYYRLFLEKNDVSIIDIKEEK